MVSHSPQETNDAGRALAARLGPGDCVLLEGPLGSGKTTFVQGVAEGLGAAGVTTSPSFVIVNEYQLPKPRSSNPIILRHLDLYRLPDPSVDADRLGLAELLRDSRVITIVEWADRIPDGLPATRLSSSKSAARSVRQAGRATAGVSGGDGPATPGHVWRVRFRHGVTETERTITVHRLPARGSTEQHARFPPPRS